MGSFFCSRCRRDLDEAAFAPSKRKNGSWCKKCHNADQTQSLRTDVAYRARILAKVIERRAAEKGWEFDLDRAWLLERMAPMVCEATGVPLSAAIPPSRRFGPWTPSVDRIDSRRGYTKDNCRIVCHMYNTAKGEGPEEELLFMAKALLAKSSPPGEAVSQPRDGSA